MASGHYRPAKGAVIVTKLCQYIAPHDHVPIMFMNRFPCIDHAMKTPIPSLRKKGVVDHQ